MSERAREPCPKCGEPLSIIGLLYSLRQEDNCRVCVTEHYCPACDTTWDRWADRPEEALRQGPPLPASVKERLGRPTD